MPNNGASSSHPQSRALPVPRQKDLPLIPWHTQLLSKLKRSCKRLVRWWWAWELLASALSIAATIALIAVLWQADNNTQHSWIIGNTELTLNTIVAAISTIIRAALLVTVEGALNQSPWNRFSSPRKGTSEPARPLEDLDIFAGAASDSWGSLRLLWRTKGLSLAAIGAALTILSLAFDTFAQQVLTIDTRNVPVQNVGAEIAPGTLLPRGMNYTNAVLPAENQDEPEAPLSANAAIISSVIDVNASVPLATCPSGNCTWPTTPTIAMCSTCTNLTLSSVQGLTNVTYSAPWGDLVNTGDENVSLAYRGAANSITHNVSVLASASGWNLDSDGHLPIASIYMFGIRPSSYQFFYENSGPDYMYSTELLDPLMAAYNCTLNFCLQAFNTSIVAGKPQQHLISSWNEMTTAGERSWSFTKPPEEMNIGNGSAYMVDSQSLRALGDAFVSVLSGNVILDDGPEKQEFVAAGSTSVGNVNAYVKAFYDASESLDTMSAFMQQIANGMTTYLRTSRQASPDRAYAPTVFTTEIFVRVRWPWLAYPLSLLFAGQVFVAATIIQTRRRRVRPWKSHRLPLLLAGIDDIVKKMAKGGLESRNGLDDRVGQMTVRLGFDERDEIVFKRVT